MVSYSVRFGLHPVLAGKAPGIRVYGRRPKLTEKKLRFNTERFSQGSAENELYAPVPGIHRYSYYMKNIKPSYH